MMYSNKCVLAILHKGKVLREVNGDVHLPFGSNYKIRAKNSGWGRVKVKVSVDGTYIHPENQAFVINSGDHLDLERMIADGNLKSGPKLKFVSLSDGRVQDPTSSDNGVVKVEFYREKYNQPLYTLPIQDIITFTDGPSCGDFTGGYIGDVTHNVNYCSSDMSNTSIGCSLTDNNGGRRLKSAKASNGATVGGKKSNQKFSTTEDFDTEYLPTTLTLKMFGLDKPTFVHDTRNKFCDTCGRKNRSKAKFCSQCGRRI